MSGQQRENERPKHGCRYGVAWEDIRQKYGKRLPAATALVAVGAEDALSAHHLINMAVRIVAIKNAMAN